MAWQTSDRYKEVIYGQDYRHKLKIWFNDVEFENADIYCEKLTIKSRILANGEERFSLNNFISKEVELVLHDIEESTLQNPVRISIGTLVDEEYEYVPIGIFNIEGSPTTDKNKTTIELRDNTVKFDFGYNAKPLMDENDGKATKKQILNDICNQAGVTLNVESFIGENDEVGIYDNTITGRQYVADIAEQAGRIATINRLGELIFLDILQLDTYQIPLSIVEKYEIGTNYKINKVVYESGIIRYDAGTDDNDILFINASNQYINESSVGLILNDVNDFEIQSVNTGKILGNPAIDSYDIIEVVDDYNDNEVIFKTLGSNTLTYNGVMIQTFETTIGEKEKELNVTNRGTVVLKKWAKTEIDNIEATIEITSGRIEEVNREVNNNYQEMLSDFQRYNETITNIETIENSVKQLQTDTYTKTEINQIASGVGVDGVVVQSVKSTAGTFNQDGLTIEKTNAKTKGNFNESGMKIIDATGSSDETLLFAGFDEELGETVVRTKNINVTKYLTIGKNSRIEDYEDGTGIFYVGGGY